MPTLTVQKVEFEVANTPGQQPVFVLGIRKSGSSIFNSMCTAMAKFNDFNVVDIGGKFFEAGLAEPDWWDNPELEKLLLPGNMYGGFRSFPPVLRGLETYVNSPKALMVRDPRDVLVSEYFSNAFSHNLPKEGVGREAFEEQRKLALSTKLEEYVDSRIEPLRATCEPYIELAQDPRLKLFRYEDVIFEKARLLRDVAAHFGWTISDHQIELILSWADVRPDTERPTEFVRRVTPGDHKEKLTDSLRSRIEIELGPFMAAFDYS